MDLKLYRQIFNIARNTRKFVEKSPELKKLMGNNMPPSLSGWCGHSSIILSHNLRQAGLDAKLVTGQGHWFVKCEQYLVDITASQFGQPDICVRNFDKTQERIKSNRTIARWWLASAIGNPRAVSLEPTVQQLKVALNIPNLWAEKCKNCGHEVVV